MSEIAILLGYAAKAVFSVLLAAVAGIVLVRSGLIRKESFRTLSTLLFYVTLPCFLFTKIVANFDWPRLKACWLLPVSCWVFIALGLGLGWAVARLTRCSDDFVCGIMTSSAFGNSGYLPIPLVAAVATIFPCFTGQSDAEAHGIAYISAYLVGFTPVLWIVGYGLLSPGGFRPICWSRIFTPPVIGILSGTTVALLPFLKCQLSTSTGILNVAFRATELLGSGTIPLALLVLGASFAEGPGQRGSLRLKTLAGGLAVRLVILPLVALAYIMTLRRWGATIDLMMALVLVIQTGSPSANNLVIMCNLSNQPIEGRMATVLFWSYLFCIITLTLFIMLTVKLLGPTVAH